MTQNATDAVSTQTCANVLARMIQLAQGALADAPRQRNTPVGGELRSSISEAPESNPSTPQPLTPQQRLKKALEDLEPEMALKMRTLMIAGRDGQDIGAVRPNVALEDSDASFDAAARDASEHGPLLADYLRRGHAMACAAALDLERPVAGWVSEPQNLDERAWLSFGRQLASSQPEEWQCLGVVDPGGQSITRLYLRLPGHAWWSFQSVLDRPSTAVVDKEKRVLSTRKSKGFVASSLKVLVERLSQPPVTSTREVKKPASQGRALRRAARAIRARVGQSTARTSEAS